MGREPSYQELFDVIVDFRDGMGVAMEIMEKRLGDRIGSVDHRVDSLEHRLSERVDSLDHRLSERLARTEDRLTLRIDGLENTMHAGFEAVNKRIDGLGPPRRRGTR